jgi:hypothetical protein
MGETWTCGRCGVRTSYTPDVREPAEPIGWARTDGEWRCLACRRMDVIEAAAPPNAAGVAAIRRRALTEFELLRDPAAPDRVIARRVRCPTRHVTPVRAALRATRRLPAAPGAMAAGIRPVDGAQTAPEGGASRNPSVPHQDMR